MNTLLEIEKLLPKKIRKQFDQEKNKSKNRVEKTQVLFKEIGKWVEETKKDEEDMIKLMKELFDVEKIQYEVEGKDVCLGKVKEGLTKLEARQKELKLEGKEAKKEIDSLKNELNKEKEQTTKLKKKLASNNTNIVGHPPNHLLHKRSLNYVDNSTYHINPTATNTKDLTIGI